MTVPAPLVRPTRSAAPARAVLAALVACLAGTCCTSAPTWRFEPVGRQPVVVTSAGAAVWTSILGLERPEGEPPRLRVRFLVESGDRPAFLDLEGTSLVSADLVAFGEPAILETGPAAGNRRTVDVGFPMPEGEADLGRLHLEWSLLVDDEPHPGPPLTFRGLAEDGGWRLTPTIGIGVGTGGVRWNGGVIVR